jgi:transposase
MRCATTAAIDLAKNVFQVALADSQGRVFKQHRLTRAQFERVLRQSLALAHDHGSMRLGAPLGRVFGARGIEVSLSGNVRARLCSP